MVTGVKKKFDSGQYRHITLAFVKKNVFFSFQYVVNIIFQIGKKKKEQHRLWLKKKLI